MIPALVLAGCLVLVIVTGRAIRNSPIECDQCGSLIAPDAHADHVAQHERPAADTDPPVSAARLAHPTRGDRWLWQEDPACRRTRLDRDGE